MAPGATGFLGAKWTPPPVAPLGFTLFAALFDRIAVVCYKETCQGQREAFPSALRSRVVLVDSDAVNSRLGIGGVDDHGYKVTQGHATAWALLESDSVQSVLVLEDDYRMLNGTVSLFHEDDGTPSATWHDVGRLVNSSDWGMLRLGYNPLDQVKHLVECRSECACAPSTDAPNVCAVTLSPNLTAKHCDVRSFVGYAVQKSLYPLLSAYAHAALDNYTQYFGQLSFAREDYHGPPDALGWITTPQDLYFPATIERIHYFTPGFLFQDDKATQVVEMTSFGLTCNARAAATPMGLAARQLPAFVLNGSTPEAESARSPGLVPPGAAHKGKGKGEPRPSPAAADEDESALELVPSSADHPLALVPADV